MGNYRDRASRLLITAEIAQSSSAGVQKRLFNLRTRGKNIRSLHPEKYTLTCLSKSIVHVCLAILHGEISTAEMLVVFGRIRRTLSEEFHASQTFCPQFCWRDTHTQSHSSANHKKSE